MKNIYFIAVNYNNSEYTLKYIESVDRLISSDDNVKIIIVDNNSKKEDYSKLSDATKDKKNLKLIRNEKNLGYFKALNIGIHDTPDPKNGLYVIGNNDLEFKEDFILELNKIKYDTKTLVLAPNVITRNGYHQNPHCITRVSKLRKLGYRIYFSNYYLGQVIYWLATKYKNRISLSKDESYKTPQFIYMGVGACYVLTGNFFNFYSKLDDRVFLWGEEALLAGQIFAVGGKTFYSPNIIVYHDTSTSIIKIPPKESYKICRESFKIYSKYL